MGTLSRLNWNLEMLVFEEKGKPEYLEKNLLEQGREPTTNSTHMWRRVRELNLGHISGRQVLSPLSHPYSPKVVCGKCNILVVILDRILLAFLILGFNCYLFSLQSISAALSKAKIFNFATHSHTT